MSRDKYSTLLGMDLGTASNRLKKQIFLQMAAELGRDLCLKCNLRIENAEDLSVDHIKPWRGADPKLFWDLSNIAFSHRKCNKPDRPKRKESPDGQAWCSTHKGHAPKSEFYQDESRWNGLYHSCKKCQREKAARYDSQNKRFPCPTCSYQMRKKCRKCGYELEMKDYMALRRKEGASY